MNQKNKKQNDAQLHYWARTKATSPTFEYSTIHTYQIEKHIEYEAAIY